MIIRGGQMFKMDLNRGDRGYEGLQVNHFMVGVNWGN